MLKILLGLLAAAGSIAFVAAPAHAVGTDYPFCMQGNEAPALSDCRYSSYEQCQATASGRLLYCIENPYFNQGERNVLATHHARSRLRSAPLLN